MLFSYISVQQAVIATNSAWNHTTFRFWNAPLGYLPQIATKLINSRNQISEAPQLDISGAL
jgi:hypothetical protein